MKAFDYLHDLFTVGKYTYEEMFGLALTPMMLLTGEQPRYVKTKINLKSGRKFTHYHLENLWK